MTIKGLPEKDIIEEYLNLDSIKSICKKYKISSYKVYSILNNNHISFRGLKGINSNDKNGMWKDDAGYGSIHYWIRRRKKKPEYCENCHEKKPKDLANISQQYHRDINDYKWLCRSCHMKEDNRIINLMNGKDALKEGKIKRDEKGRFFSGKIK